MMKDRRFWPEQEEQAKALAISERKLLTIEYEAGADADGLRVLTMEELTELKSGMYANPYDGWIAVLEDHTEKTGAAWRTLQAVNRRFRELDAEEQTIDVLNDLPEAGLKLEDITEEFISYMRASGHELTYSIPAGPAGYRGESVPGIFRGDEPRLPGERKRPGDDGGNGVKNKDGWATGMTGRKAGKMKIIAKVPKDTTPYRCGERLMACITKGETLEIEKCVEFFKTTEEARSFTAENPEYKFKSQNG